MCDSGITKTKTVVQGCVQWGQCSGKMEYRVPSIHVHVRFLWKNKISQSPKSKSKALVAQLKIFFEQRA